MRQQWLQLRSQFPDVCIELNDLIAEGNRVVVRGPLGRFLEVFQIADGRITDVWNILTFARGWVEYGTALWLQR